MSRLLKILFSLSLFISIFLNSSHLASAQSINTYVDKVKALDLADRWFEGGGKHYLNERIDQVISQSISAGVDPAISVTIWIIEAGASNYTGICEHFGNSDPNSIFCNRLQDFGINLTSLETVFNGLTGEILEDRFQDQLSFFLNLPGAYESRCGCADMGSFFSLFRTGSSCDPSSGDLAYIDKVQDYYQMIAHQSLPTYLTDSSLSTCDHPGSPSTTLTPSSLSTTQDPHPLRPYPNQFTPEESAKTLDPSNPNPNLTVFCAKRPTITITTPIDKRNPSISLTAFGSLSSNFQNFITPLLSITDSRKQDFNLSDIDKAKDYLTDYLEGRAYYETTAESSVPSGSTASSFSFLESFLPSRVGVFRKLAPQIYQDQLKVAMIQRASGDFVDDESNPYGFSPTSNTVHNYIVAHWNGSKVVSYNRGGTPIKLTDFINHLKPFPEDFVTSKEHTNAISNWQQSDNQKWSKLWPYIPMFTREDTKAYIQPIDEPDQNSGSFKEVSIPHLARTYEVASVVSYMIRPYSDPGLRSEWISPPPWDSDSSWIKSDNSQPGNWDNLGPLCDPQTDSIFSSGDLAHSSTITTTLGSVPNPYYDPTCDDVPEEDSEETDPPSCFVNQSIKFNPVYLKTYTPYLHNLVTQLVTGPNALFSAFKGYSRFEPPLNQIAGVGYDSQENPTHSFQGNLESGKFFFKYLGNIHCAKENFLSAIQPFVSGSTYEIDPQCKQDPVELTSFPGVACSTEKEPLSFGNTESNSIAKRAWEIVSDLYQGFWCYWNRSPGDFEGDITSYPQSYPNLFDEAAFLNNPHPTYTGYTNLFWCTWLVVKSYQETGYDMPVVLWVPTMADYFKNNHTLYKEGDLNILNASAGDAIFFQIGDSVSSYRWGHVAIIYSVTPGGITTVESNAGYKTMFYPTNSDGSFQKVGEINIVGIGKISP